MKKIILRLVTAFAVLLFALPVRAQVDTAFWFAVPKLCSHAHDPITLVVSTLNEPATVKLTRAYNGVQVGNTLTVPAHSSQTLTIVANSSGLSNFECNHNTTSNNGLYVHSTAKINAYVAVQQNNSEIYALKGGNGLGTQFYVAMQYHYDNGNGSGSGSYGQARNSVEVIATENNTTVTITPSATCGTHPANVPFTVTLQKGQVYCFASNSQLGSNHLCGSTIVSDKPVVVDVSDDSVTPHSTPNQTTNDGNGSADLVADQLVPESKAGSTYVVMPSPSACNNNATASSGGGNYYLDYAFVFALEDNTTVKIWKQNYQSETYTMNRGDKIKYHFTNDFPITVDAYSEDPETLERVEKKVFVFQVTGSGREFGGTQLPQIVCTGSEAVSYRPIKSYHDHSKLLYMTLLCHTDYTTGFQVNGNANFFAASDWQEVPGMPEYKFCRKNVSNNFAPTVSNMIPFRVTNSLGKFHMGVFDVNRQDANNYDDCSISYFSNYAPESHIRFDTLITLHDYAQGDTIFFAFDSVDVTITRILGPDGFDLTEPPFYIPNAMPSQSGQYVVVAEDNGLCTPTQYDTTEITIHPPVYSTVYDTICPGTAYSGHGFDLTAAQTAAVGTVYDTLELEPVVCVCDSFLVLELNVRDSVKKHTVYDSVCYGAAYTGFGGLFSFPADSAMQVRTIFDTVHLTPQGVGACDSLLILELTVRDSVRSEFSKFACNQFTWNGHTYVETGDYRQTLVDRFGCDSIVTMHLEIDTPAVVITTNGDDFCEHGELILNAETVYEEYIWNTGETTPFITATQPGLYTVTVTQGECQANDHYTVPACEFTLYIPNTITPSRSDGLNDYLYLPEYVHRFITEFDIEIFDRWGELIYKTNDPNFRWAGEKAHVSDTYIWIITVKNLDGKPFVYKGTVTVL